MLYEMRVRGLTLDPLTNMPIIMLKDKDGTRALPIWVGIFEANAIALELEQIDTPRPMTHDLMKNIIHELKGTVNRIVVNELRNNTYYAYIDITSNGNRLTIDSRPSDAIALALRFGAPIFVAEEVVEQSRAVEMPEPAEPPTDSGDDESEKQLKDWLKKLKPEDFGKYQM
ncbi:MAG: bifunctional nuclease family protein [Candidatus Schekmanbacteria bacterium]|nr:bifunctional nuclease family protein [Candidatus Schekmanbacteria bacterium]